jgi:hypothetical protein
MDFFNSAMAIFPPFFSEGCTLRDMESWCDTVSMEISWRDLYRAALLELSPERLQERIEVAEKAIQRRRIELRQDDSGSDGESRELNDALRGLRVLAVTECKPPRPTSPGFVTREATS